MNVNFFPFLISFVQNAGMTRFFLFLNSVNSPGDQL